MATMTTTETVEPGSTRLGKPIRLPVRVTLGSLTPNNQGTLRKLNQFIPRPSPPLLSAHANSPRRPQAYSDKFYRDVLDTSIAPEDYNKLIFYQDLAVGNVVCRLEPEKSERGTTISGSMALVGEKGDGKEKGPMKLYIMTLGVLRPYRRQGLATKLISHIISTAEASHHPAPPPTPSSILAEIEFKKAAQPKASTSKLEKEKDDKKKKEEPVVPVISSLYLHVQIGNDEARRFWEKNGFEVVDTVKGYYKKIEPRDAWVLEKVIKA
ncbi:hypothetical protein P7C70_g8725, partial [Phenoliferia sp. Uapishka_3]